MKIMKLAKYRASTWDLLYTIVQELQVYSMEENVKIATYQRFYDGSAEYYPLYTIRKNPTLALFFYPFLLQSLLSSFYPFPFSMNFY